MGLLITGIVLFFGIHLLPAFVGPRQRLVDMLGEAGYKTAFSLTSAIGFVFMLYGWRDVPHDPVFDPPAFSLLLSKVVMLPAFILLVAAYVPSNIRRLVGHPMIISVLLWALVHVLANGDRASLILFGAFLLYAIFDWASVVRRQTERPAPASRRNDLIVVAVGVAVYIVVYRLHGRFFAPLG